MTTLDSARMLRLSAVVQRTGLSKSTIYRLIKEEKFPAPIHLGRRAVGWPAHRINDWIDARQRATDDAVRAELELRRRWHYRQGRTGATASPPKSQTFTRETDRRTGRRGSSGAAGRTNLAELEVKIGRLIAALEEGGHVPSIMDRLVELEAERDKLMGRLAP